MKIYSSLDLLIIENCKKAVNEVAPILKRTGYFAGFKMYVHPWSDFTNISDIVDIKIVYDDGEKGHRKCLGFQYELKEIVRSQLEFFKLDAAKKEIEEALKKCEIKL